MATPGQRKGACGHIMASFDSHSRCARCRDKGLGEDPCVKKLQCDLCDLLTPEQIVQLSTPTYKLRKEKKQERDALVDPSTVTVLSPVDQGKSLGASSSLNTSADLSLPQPSFKVELKELDDKWSLRMARLEALITMGQHPQTSFSPVKAPVPHGPPAGAMSQAPFLISSVPSGQTGPVSGPDGTAITTSVGMTSPLENLYPEQVLYSSEPVFSQPGTISFGDVPHSVLASSTQFWYPLLYLPLTSPRILPKRERFQTKKRILMISFKTLIRFSVRIKITSRQSLGYVHSWDELTFPI